MDSRRLGNDLCLAWPGAEIAVMGTAGAIQILGSKGLTAEEYEDAFLNPWRAAERGVVDAVIDPRDTRRVLVDVFATLRTKRARHRVPQTLERPPVNAHADHEDRTDVARRQTLSRHWCAQRCVDRVRSGAPGPTRRRRGGAHLVRTGHEPHAARRTPPPQSRRAGDRARHHQRRRPRGVGRQRRRITRRRGPCDCLRARVVPRRRLPHRAVGRRRCRAACGRVLAAVARRRMPAAVR